MPAVGRWRGVRRRPRASTSSAPSGSSAHTGFAFRLTDHDQPPLGRVAPRLSLQRYGSVRTRAPAWAPLRLSPARPSSSARQRHLRARDRRRASPCACAHPARDATPLRHGRPFRRRRVRDPRRRIETDAELAALAERILAALAAPVPLCRRPPASQRLTGMVTATAGRHRRRASSQRRHRHVRGQANRHRPLRGLRSRLAVGAPAQDGATSIPPMTASTIVRTGTGGQRELSRARGSADPARRRRSQIRRNQQQGAAKHG